MHMAPGLYLFGVVAVLFFAATASATLARHCPQAHCDDPHFLANQNIIVQENCKAGNASNEWDVNGAGDPTIQGFSTDISFNRGTRAEFKIDTISTQYRIDIFRMGFYQGLGARHVATVHPSASLPQRQPPCRREEETRLYDCANWAVSAHWDIPHDAVSGVYIARLVRMETQPGEHVTWRADNSPAKEDPRFAMPGGASMRRPQPQPHAYGANGHGQLRNALKEPRASHIYFVVRCDECAADILFQTADTVWQAYNSEGGASTYGSMDPANPGPRCYKASYNRPLRTRHTRSVNMYLGSEYPISRFLEAQGYHVTYVAGVDVDRSGRNLLPKRRIFMSVGHDEYWSGRQRENIEWARDSLGMHLVFLSGNEMYWRVRWEDNFRVMVVYKESQSLVKIDPNATEWTGTFRDSRPINPLGANPENAVTGTIFTLNAWRNDPLIVPFEYSKLRQWRDTSVAALRPGQHAILHRGILGHEMDEDLDNGFRPAGLIRLSETNIDNVMYIQDFGSTFDSGSGVHHLVMYKAPSGAIVFGAGTVQWGWALDGFHDSEHQLPANFVNHLNTRVGTDVLAPCRPIQQFTVNFLADMGAQPATLDKNLKRAEGPHDSFAPQCNVLGVVPLPPDATSLLDADKHRFMVVAKASDRHTGDGVVAAIEVQIDMPGFDNRWHPAPRAKTSTTEGVSLAGVPNARAAIQELLAAYQGDPSTSSFRRTMPDAGASDVILSGVFPKPVASPADSVSDPDALNVFAFIGTLHAGRSLDPHDGFAVRCRAVDDSLNLAMPSPFFRAEVRQLDASRTTTPSASLDNHGGEL